MTTARTKIFGMDLGVDPKVVVLGLIVLAGVVYYFTSSSEPSGGSGGSSAALSQPLVRPALNTALVNRNRRGIKNDREVLKFVPVDGSRGDIDPTLRLALLERLKNVPAASGQRNVFDAAGPVVAQNVPPVPLHPPIMKPNPILSALAGPAGPVTPALPPFSIPLKYFGFAKSKGRSADGSRGLFLDGENILIGAEGDLLEKRFLIVALTPTTARLEDTQVKQGQDLQVTPEAPPAQ